MRLASVIKVRIERYHFHVYLLTECLAAALTTTTEDAGAASLLPAGIDNDGQHKAGYP